MSKLAEDVVQSSQVSSMKKKTAKNKASPSPLKTAYLFLYNSVAFLGWAYVLYKSSLHFWRGEPYYKLYQFVGWDVTMVQSLAVLEIIHSLLGLVSSPLFTTLVQNASRLLLVWGICYLFDEPQVRMSLAFTSMVYAWSITEVVRYSFYALGLYNIQPKWLLWCRYSFFSVLYPIGASSEAILVFLSVRFAKELHSVYHMFLVTVIMCYPPGLYMMYTYMLKQRKRVLGGQQLKKMKKSQ